MVSQEAVEALVESRLAMVRSVLDSGTSTLGQVRAVAEALLGAVERVLTVCADAQVEAAEMNGTGTAYVSVPSISAEIGMGLEEGL